MKRVLLTGLVCLAAFALAGRQGDFYVEPKLQDYNLVIDFTQHNLPSGQMMNFAVMGKAKATYACIERGDPAGKRAINHRVINKVQYSEGLFQVGGEGWVRQLLFLDPPPVNESEICSDPNQRMVLAAIEYRDVRVINLSTKQTYKIPGKFGKVFFNIQ